METDNVAVPSGPLRVGVIAGSTRPTRRSPAIAQWVASDRSQPDLRLEVVDLATFDLPMLGEPLAAVFGSYEHKTTRHWAAAIAGYHAYVIVVPEYNASFPGVLKNALDHLYAEWNDKPVAFAGYGMSGGGRAVEQLRQVAEELRMHPVATSLSLSPNQVVDGRYAASAGDVEARARMLAELSRALRAAPAAAGGITR
ncbi:NADPH-dependent FMN reductase [Micromonospora sp. NBC_01813]|uniref:NADPH-dependent FMN reductase n=1 Tax=Micromonospora sp. NBC_01813 TaxID=2975988 RepID=UPI002DDA4CB1|nr:NAD(P)H-dependent oxidoreductase [Micromonospora sp. NBC_01813]WSA11372.1 NAD(P)H-dependent oxidoreductase [Micromonospora sp. NBC_01813]